MSYLNCTDAAIAEAERQRTGNYGDCGDSEEAEETVECELCGRTVECKDAVEDDGYFFCDDECRDEYYDDTEQGEQE